MMCYCACVDKGACAICTKLQLRHLEMLVELSVSLSDGCGKFVGNKGLSTICHRADWCVNHSLQSNQFFQ